MRTVNEFLDSIVSDGTYMDARAGSEVYTFAPSLNKLTRRGESHFGDDWANAVIERLSDVDGSAARVLIGSVLRLVLTRQKIYEEILTKLLPSWRTILQGNPQTLLPEEFFVASTQAQDADVPCSAELIEALRKATYSNCADVAVAAIKACEQIGTEESLAICDAVRGSATNEHVAVRATLATARLACLSNFLQQQVRDIAFDQGASPQMRKAALEVVFLTQGDDKSDRFAQDLLEQPHGDETLARSVLTAAMDTGREQFSEAIGEQLGDFDLPKLPDSSLWRVTRFSALPTYLRSAAALEIANRNDVTNDSDSRAGLLVHRNSGIEAAFIGHTGIFVDDTHVVHCTVGRDPDAISSDTFVDWKDGQECWGAREDDDHNVDLATAIRRAREITSWRTEYDGNHLNQKGEWIKGWFCAPKYWEADCVGFTEHCYEYAGGNPTPNEFEFNLGWPLTPREQRDHMRKALDC